MICPQYYPYVQGPVPIQGIAAPVHVHYDYAATKVQVPTPPPASIKAADKPADEPPPSAPKSKSSQSSTKSTKSGWTSRTASTKASSATAVSHPSSHKSAPRPPPPPPVTAVPATPAPKKRPVTGPTTPRNRPGTNDMFPSEHTVLHVLQKAARVWEEKYVGCAFQFNIYNVGTTLTVRDVMQNVMRAKVEGDWEKCKGWACTEVIERGDGKWQKGTTIDYDSDKAEGTLGSMGWNAKRGESLPPVWITIHRVGL